MKTSLRRAPWRTRAAHRGAHVQRFRNAGRKALRAFAASFFLVVYCTAFAARTAFRRIGEGNAFTNGSRGQHCSRAAQPTGAAIPSALAEHNAYQASTFDEAADFFASDDATPPTVVPRMRRIATACQLGADTSILDVATGTGAMIPFYQEQGANLSLLLGVDLSEGMLKHARKRFPHANFVHADILNFSSAAGAVFDRIVFNAVFGNLFDQAATLRHVAETLLQDGGLVIVSHPLGRRWLREVLSARDPRMVPHGLPTEDEWQQLLKAGGGVGLSLSSLDDEADYYCATLSRS